MLRRIFGFGAVADCENHCGTTAEGTQRDSEAMSMTFKDFSERDWRSGSGDVPELHQRELLRYNTDTADGSKQARLLRELNRTYAQRLREIDFVGCGDTELKLSTYQEWTEMLVKLNESMIRNVDELEGQVCERLHRAGFLKANVEASQNHIADVNKYRKDICALLKVIQNGYHNSDWDLSKIHFHTLAQSQVLCLFNNPPNKNQDDSFPRPSTSKRLK